MGYTEYNDFMKNIFYKDPDSAIVYNSEIGKTLAFSYGGRPLYVKNISLRLSNNGNTEKQMGGETLFQTQGANLDYKIGSSKYPVSNMTISGVVTSAYTLTDNAPTAVMDDAWIYFIKDSINATLNRTIDTTSYYPIAESASITLSPDSINWEISFKNYGIYGSNFNIAPPDFAKTSGLILTSMTEEMNNIGINPSLMSGGYSNISNDLFITQTLPTRINKWYDLALLINPDISNVAGNIPFIRLNDSSSIMFYLSQMKITYTIDKKEYYQENIQEGNEDTNIFTDDDLQCQPVIFPTRIQTNIDLTGFSPVIMSNTLDMIDSSKLFLYKRKINKDDIQIWINKTTRLDRILDIVDADGNAIDNNNNAYQQPFYLIKEGSFTLSPEDPIKCDFKMTSLFS